MNIYRTEYKPYGENNQSCLFYLVSISQIYALVNSLYKKIVSKMINNLKLFDRN